MRYIFLLGVLLCLYLPPILSLRSYFCQETLEYKVHNWVQLAKCTWSSFLIIQSETRTVVRFSQVYFVFTPLVEAMITISRKDCLYSCKLVNLSWDTLTSRGEQVFLTSNHCCSRTSKMKLLGAFLSCVLFLIISMVSGKWKSYWLWWRYSSCRIEQTTWKYHNNMIYYILLLYIILCNEKEEERKI